MIEDVGGIPPELDPQSQAQAIKHNLRRLERRDWALWGAAFVVIFALTGTVAALSVSVLTDPSEPFFQFHISQAVRGLTGLVLIFTTYTAFQEFRLKRVRTELARQITITAEHHARAEAYLRLAMLDPLTGLHNRRFGEERLAAEMSRARRHSTALTVLLLDLNDFKRVNDTHGHQAGDHVLKQFAHRLNKSIRGADLAVRLGGDEFMVVLPDCTPSQVQRVIARLRPCALEWSGMQFLVHFAAGWTDFQGSETLEDLIARADAALYLDKKDTKVAPAPQPSAR
ncbi:MAG TPA: GGDEF domain-containing protein [Candidatus Acidoferrales bacterium]